MRSDAAQAAASHTQVSRLLDERLERFGEQLTHAADESYRKAWAVFEDRWLKRVDEELALKLDGHRRHVEEQMESLFGDGSDKSVLMRLRRLLAEYGAAATKELQTSHAGIRKEMSELITGTGNPDHPLVKIDSKIDDLAKELAVELEAQRGAAAAHQARQRAAPAGFDYQTTVHFEVAEILKGTGDLVEEKGRSPGVTGGAEGDIVVTVDPGLTTGFTARVSVEATKSMTKLTMTSIRNMLMKGKSDRSAQAAILVVRDPKVLGGQRYVEVNGLGVAVVYEPEDPDDFRCLPLTVALKTARAMAVREAKPSAAERNDAAIERACQDAKAALDAVETMIGNQTKIVRLAEGTTTVATEMRRRVLSAVACIDDALSS